MSIYSRKALYVLYYPSPPPPQYFLLDELMIQLSPCPKKIVYFSICNQKLYFLERFLAEILVSHNIQQGILSNGLTQYKAASCVLHDPTFLWDKQGASLNTESFKVVKVLMGVSEKLSKNFMFPWKIQLNGTFWV